MNKYTLRIYQEFRRLKLLPGQQQHWRLVMIAFFAGFDIGTILLIRLFHL